MKGTAHRFFKLGILIKGIDGALQLVSGLLLLILSPATINSMVFFFVPGELQEDPSDGFVNFLLHVTQNIIHTKTLTILFLLFHGVVKLLLVVGLATNKRWSYPAAIVAFAAFTVFQLYQLIFQHSWFLGAVTVLDVIVIFLVIEEYRHVRIQRRASLRTTR